LLGVARIGVTAVEKVLRARIVPRRRRGARR
jgi:hypothetical protein